MDILNNNLLEILPSNQDITPIIREENCSANSSGTPKDICLPPITGISDTHTCKGRQIDPKCLTSQPSLTPDEQNLCNAQIYCFYSALRIAASCKVAIGTLNLIPGNNGSCNDNISLDVQNMPGSATAEERIEKYCNSMCSHPKQLDECKSVLPPPPRIKDIVCDPNTSTNCQSDLHSPSPFTCIPTTLVDCINYYYQNHPLYDLSNYFRSKSCMGDKSTPFCLQNCLDYSQITLDNSRFLCTY